MPNKKGPAVPKRPDARTARTQRALGEALVALMFEHEFADITVQDVLDRAGVGRSTFYAHFRNKDDLLLSDAERFLGLLERHLEQTAGGSGRVAPLGELAAHVADYADFAAAIERSTQRDALWDLFVGHFAGIIERRLARLAPHAEREALPREMSARRFAAAAISLLRWWMERGQPMSASELDARFHAMVWRGIPGSLGPQGA
jgi:AcrR family transcriptional regulator